MKIGQGGKRAFTLLLTSFVFSLTHGPLLAWEVKSARELPVADSGIRHLEIQVGSDREETVNAVLFDAKKCRLAVVDDPTGNADLASAMTSRGALAGVNGGYFHPDHTPLGLVISAGRKLHAAERAKLLSGFLVARGERASLHRIGDLPAKVDHALQAGPFLVDRGRPVTGLNASRSARRTVVVADAKGVRALVVLTPVTLAEAGQILVTPKLFGNLVVARALNLDGGSSTALWVRTNTEPFYLREFKTVRNYVAIMPR